MFGSLAIVVSSVDVTELWCSMLLIVGRWAMLLWFDRYGMVWDWLVPLLGEAVVGTVLPQVLVIHLAEYNLGEIPRSELIARLLRCFPQVHQLVLLRVRLLWVSMLLHQACKGTQVVLPLTGPDVMSIGWWAGILQWRYCQWAAVYVCPAFVYTLPLFTSPMWVMSYS